MRRLRDQQSLGERLIVQVAAESQQLPPLDPATTIDLSSMQIGLIEAFIIGTRIAGNTKVTALVLNENQLGDDSLRVLLHFLESNRSLSTLSVPSAARRRQQ